MGEGFRLSIAGEENKGMEKRILVGVIIFAKYIVGMASIVEIVNKHRDVSDNYFRLKP